MTDLFDWSPPKRTEYPDEPGFKEPTTSKDAAEAMKPRAPGLRTRAKLALAEHGPMTPDEIAAAVGVSVLSMRPRITELKLLGEIELTGERHCNLSGLKANVWRLRP
jgi:predicted Rossmann fold nucleotide-binding protein DprA/Smf involved in DNA uptake